MLAAYKNQWKGSDTTQDYKDKWKILLAVSIGVLMVPLNASIINVSIPTIAEFFAVNVATAEWGLTSYLIMFIGLVLFFARTGDFYGHERIFIVGLFGFIVSSIFCSLSPSITILILFRGLQGVTASMILAVSMVIIEKSFPLQYLGKAFGIYAVVTSTGLALGPVIGGIMNSLFGWRSIFLVNIPIGVLALIISRCTLKSSTTQEVKWDIPGTVLQFVYLFLIIYSLNLIEKSDYTTALIIGLLAVAGFITFIITESRSENPMIKLNLFKNRVFSAFNICLHFNFLCMYMILFIMPFYLEKVLHLGTSMTGMVLIASPLVMIMMGPVGGALSDKLGSRIPIFLGSAICALALLLLSQLTVSSTIFDIFWRLALLGLGAALFQPSANYRLMSIFPSKNAGMASGIIATVRNMGMVFAVCYGGLILNSAISPALMLQSQLFGSAALDLTTGMQRAMIFGALLSTLMVILSFTGVKNKKTAITNHMKIIGESLEREVNKLIETRF